MTIRLNGRPHPLEAGMTIAGLLAELGLADRRVAIERNRNIVPRSEWDTTELAEDDSVEVVQFVGGG